MYEDGLPEQDDPHFGLTFLFTYLATYLCTYLYLPTKTYSVKVAHLPNKAVIGLACRYHDKMIAFVNGHFNADKKGKEKIQARIRVST